MENKNLQSNIPYSSSRSDRAEALRAFVFPGTLCACGKTPEQLKRQVYQLLEEHEAVLVTGVDDPAGNILATAFPEGEYDPTAHVFLIRPLECKDENAFILASAREDLPWALEAKYALIACGIGSRILLLPDLGNLKKLAEIREQLLDAKVCIALAGSLTALPEIAASLTDAPVIALPTAVLNANPLSGVLSLSGTLASSAKGLVAVGCSNASGAGFAAARIIRAAQR